MKRGSVDDGDKKLVLSWCSSLESSSADGGSILDDSAIGEVRLMEGIAKNLVYHSMHQLESPYF